MGCLPLRFLPPPRTTPACRFSPAGYTAVLHYWIFTALPDFGPAAAGFWLDARLPAAPAFSPFTVLLRTCTLVHLPRLVTPAWTRSLPGFLRLVPLPHTCLWLLPFWIHLSLDGYRYLDTLPLPLHLPHLHCHLLGVTLHWIFTFCSRVYLLPACRIQHTHRDSLHGFCVLILRILFYHHTMRYIPHTPVTSRMPLPCCLPPTCLPARIHTIPRSWMGLPPATCTTCGYSPADSTCHCRYLRTACHRTYLPDYRMRIPPRGYVGGYRYHHLHFVVTPMATTVPLHVLLPGYTVLPPFTTFYAITGFTFYRFTTAVHHHLLRLVHRSYLIGRSVIRSGLPVEISVVH